MKNVIEKIALVPSVDKTYVKYGYHKTVKQILETGMFCPIYIAGLSGNGKTIMVTQICAETKRKLIRVNISIETDEDDLVGGYTLENGNMVYRDGPAIIAMREGAVLLLDEVDRGSNKLMCLQSILEGGSFYNKKTGETITPVQGFNVVATANTKGDLSENEDKYISAQLLDDAFVERFAITIDQKFGSVANERKILLNNMKAYGCTDEEFADNLIKWADLVRKSYNNGVLTDVISTRRLTHIVRAFSIFKDKFTAIELCVSRYNSHTKSALIDLYRVIDASFSIPVSEEEQAEVVSVVEAA
jgi:MoxR-like ATPase